MQITLEKLKSKEDLHDQLYGQKDLMRKNVFVFTMQADDMSDKDYQHESVYYCVCLVVNHIIQLKKTNQKSRGTNKSN